MTTIHPSRHLQSNLRSNSDPFIDPVTPSRRPPPVPPKNISPRMPAPVSKTAAPLREPHREVVEAVRDTVFVRGSTDNNPRSRVGRSLTTQAPSTGVRQTVTQSHSQESTNRQEKSKTSTKGRSKKGSQHADVIDRLDFTGVGPMFHHDGPFDACAPSRNRQRNKAPMFAWTPRLDDPLASGDGAYPSAEAYKAFSNTNYVDPPKKKVDAIAEAWGIHEPEPYEEFFAGGGTSKGTTPASSIYNGGDSHNRTKDTRDSRDVYREDSQSSNANASRPRGVNRRTLIPPPQPIFVPDPSDVPSSPGTSPPLSASGIPKRTKSLMHRIRKMRDAPNVPVDYDYDSSPTSPTEHSYPGANGARPTHRPQNSFLGRFSGGNRSNQLGLEKPEPFVYIEANSKELPATPDPKDESAENVPSSGYLGGRNASPSPGLGRKNSLMQKVGRVVGRSRQ